MMLDHAKNIFIVGIKGVAMANLAVILKKMGKKVKGCDISDEFITDKLLKKYDISFSAGFEKEYLDKKTDLVIYSAAHFGVNNPVVIEAHKRKIPIVSQTEILGELMKRFQIKIAVAGCHGKTTTSSLLAYALNKLGEKPSYLVGTPFFTDFGGSDYQKEKYFIIEADEYGINPPLNKTPKFFNLDPDWIICTNIDFDHPDVYKNIEETKDAFIKFFDNKKLIINIDDTNLLHSINRLKNKVIITYGFSDRAQYQITNWKVKENYSSFEIKGVGIFNISLFGQHNIANATAVIVQLLNLGFKAEEIKKIITGFYGAKRRFEFICKKNDIYLFDDYAHHPNEIKATILAARSRFPKKRIIVIFQPHTYSRTLSLLPDFAGSLSLADRAYVLPIFSSARENSENFQISSDDIVKLNPDKLIYVSSKDQLFQFLSSTLQTQDVIFTMGAGDVYKLKDEIIKLIQKLKLKTQEHNSDLKIEKNKELFPYLTLKIKAKAEFFFEARSKEDLIEARKFAHKNNLLFLIIGGGSNLVITKKVVKGLVVKNSYQYLKILKEDNDLVEILVSSGYPVSKLVQETIEKGYQGFEYHKGLPGTVGGAIYMNSKWTKPFSCFGDVLKYAYLLDNQGRVFKVDKSYFQFGYDYSILQKTGEIVLEAVFQLKKQFPAILKKRAEEAWVYRLKTQPFGMASSGCFFRNPGKVSAGYLIDQAGLKGFSVGNFVISDKHANFILNKGGGKPEDLMKLLKIIKQRVKDKFQVELEEEVIII